MSNTKFDDFFYDGELILLSDVLTDDGTLMDNYDRFSLYCPYCQSVRLKFYSRTSQKSAYLSTWPDSKHAEYCPASFTPAKKKESVNYYEELSSKQIQDKLNSLLRSLTKDDCEQIHSNQSKLVKVANDAAGSITPAYARYLPKRTLESIPCIEPELRDIPIAFYGKAYVEFTPEFHNPEYNQIHLKRPSNKKLFLYMKNGETDLYVPKNVDTDILYTVIFIGVYDTGEIFPRLISHGAFLLCPAKD